MPGGKTKARRHWIGRVWTASKFHRLMTESIAQARSEHSVQVDMSQGQNTGVIAAQAQLQLVTVIEQRHTPGVAVGGDQLLPLHVLIVRDGHRRDALAHLLPRRDALLQLRALQLRLLPAPMISAVTDGNAATLQTSTPRNVLLCAVRKPQERKATAYWPCFPGETAAESLP